MAVPFFDGGQQPLTTLAWPKSAQEAERMPRLPHTFVRCVDCGHVYNSDFDYAQVPYSDKPSLMFNKGAIWSDHLRMVQQLILGRLPERPTVVEIGCGEGHLLRSLALERPHGRYLGFDPNATIETGDGLIEARAMLFDPAVHLAEFRPDLIISRHVLEHLMNPLGFVQALAFAVSWEGIETRLFLEVPCIEQVLSTGRTVDFFYEHNSHFTTTSLTRMLSRCATDVELIETGYNAEVLYAIAGFRRQLEHVETTRSALEFRARAAQYQSNLHHEIKKLCASGKRVAIWGGAGKAASFINQNGLDRDRFPIVVDSDANKAGTFVPGTGQEIHHRDFLYSHPADVILIATQWRAADIVLEIRRCGISFETILIEHQGRLLDYFGDEHPYRSSTVLPAEREPEYQHVIGRPKFLATRSHPSVPKSRMTR